MSLLSSLESLLTPEATMELLMELCTSRQTNNY